MPADLVLRLTAMGDLLLAIPTARMLNQAGREVHWVISSRWRDLAPFLPATIHEYSGASGLLALAGRLRALHPDRVIDLQGKASTFLLGWLLRRPLHRYGKRQWQESLRAWVGRYPLRDGDPRPVWERYLQTARVADTALPVVPDPRLAFPAGYLDDCAAWARRELGGDPAHCVLLHPGASHAGKRLPVPAAETLLAALALPVALIGDGPTPAMAGARFDWRGRVPLARLPGVLALSRGVISTDSGPMHLARAVERPLAAVFLQTDPSLGFAPIPGGRVRIISRPLPCKPCSLHGQRLRCPEGDGWACRDLDWRQIGTDLRPWFGEAA